MAVKAVAKLPEAVRRHPFKQLLIARDIDGNPFAFSTLTCQLYRLDEKDVSHFGEKAVVHSSAVREVDEDIDNAILENGIDGLVRRHTPGIALIVSQTCNLTCSYCLAKQGTFGLPVANMNIETVKARLYELFQQHPNIDFIKFFGGEPTLAIDLIEQVCTFVSDELGKTLHFALTTNGTLDARSHIDLWKQFHISVSVSIDGPEYIHDAVRINASNRGSFRQAMQYCEVLSAEDFPFAAVGVFDERHVRSGFSYVDMIKFLNTVSPLSKVQFIEALGDAVEDPLLAKFDLDEARKQVENAIDTIFDAVKFNWLTPKHPQWLYDNNLFRFIYGVMTKNARPYEHACTASRLTTIFPGGQVMPCYTFSERPALHYGGRDTPISQIEMKRAQYLDEHTWQYLATQGAALPWYRGVVGDICVADMLNSSPNGLESSPFYRCFQETAVFRILQHLSSSQKDAMFQARLLAAIEQHKILTGEYTAKMGYQPLKQTG